MNKIIAALSRKLGEYSQDSREWYHFSCPKCGTEKKKFGVSLWRMRFYCVRCHCGGDIASLLRELGIQMEWEGGGHAHKPAPRQQLPAEIPGFIPFADALADLKSVGPTSLFLRDCVKYAEKRAGLSLEGLAQLGWGYAKVGPLAMRLIVPVVVDGVMVSYLARSIYDFLEPKEKGGPVELGWWPRTDLALGLDEIDTKQILLVEGIWDRVHVRRALGGTEWSVVSTLGSHLSAFIAGRLLSHRPKQVCIFYDGDDAGREGTLAAVKLLNRRRGTEVFVARPPEGKDPDDLSPAKIRSTVRGMRYWMSLGW